MSTIATFDANNADAHRVAGWLETALDGYIKDDMGRWAFHPLEQYIGTRDDLADDLCAIYDTLAAPAQTRWRNAIRDVLAIHGRDISRRETTRVLIAFAVLIRSAEVLEVLPSILSAPEDSELLDLAIGAATALASQTEASRRCLEQIRTSPSFTPDYAGLVLVALCHADPENWLRHVNDLALPMRRLTGLLPSESTALRFYASKILDAISLSRITGAHLRALSGAVGTESPWLLKEWFQDDQSLLRLRPTATGVRLVLRTDDSVSSELKGLFDARKLEPLGPKPNEGTAIAWQSDANDKVWVAVCTRGELIELTREPSLEALEAIIGGYMGNQTAFRWPEPFPRHGSIYPAGADKIPKITTDDLCALWDRKVGNKITKRISYMGKYRQRVKPVLRRVTFRNRRAFSVALSALVANDRPDPVAGEPSIPYDSETLSVR